MRTSVRTEGARGRADGGRSYSEYLNRAGKGLNALHFHVASVKGAHLNLHLVQSPRGFTAPESQGVGQPTALDATTTT